MRQVTSAKSNLSTLVLAVDCRLGISQYIHIASFNTLIITHIARIFNINLILGDTFWTVTRKGKGY